MDCPIQMKDTFKFRFNVHQKNLRDKPSLDLPTVKSAMGQSTFKYGAATLHHSTVLNVQFILILQLLLMSQNLYWNSPTLFQ